MRVHFFCPCNKTLPLIISKVLTPITPFSSSTQIFASTIVVMGGNTIKKLRKLPHVFSKVLELPIPSDADVEVEENPELFRFVAEIEQHGENIGNVRAQVVEIHPGVTKMVVRNGGGGGGGGGEEELLMLDQLKVDTWRFRLPPSAKPELATAVFADGRLIVTMPKGVNDRRGYGGRDVLVGRGNTRLVLV